MVFTGRPSAGCATCKRRKKKCDLTKPFCKQCKNLGKQCPGVPDEVDTLFRHTLVKPSARSSQRAVPEDQLSKPNEKQQVEHTIPFTIPTDWVSTAVAYYFHLYSLKDSSTKQLNPWFELQSRYYIASSSDTGLHHAVTALATMTMAIDMQIPEFAKKANLAYGRALRAVNKSLADTQKQRRNDVAMGVFALVSFELKQQDTDFYLRYETHIEGMKQLLILRGAEQLEDPESFRVFRSIRPLIIYHHILRRRALIEMNDSKSIWRYTVEGSFTPIDDLCGIAAKLPTLLARAKQIRASSPSPQISYVVANSIELSTELLRWRAIWQHCLRYEITYCKDKDQPPEWWHGRMHMFSEFPSATLVCQYNFLYIQILEALLKGLSVSVSLGDDSTAHLAHSDVLSQIQNSVDEICYAVPFITGYNRPRVYPSYGEAVWILLPIVVASLQQNVCAEQRAWLTQQLTSLHADFNLFDPTSLPYDMLKIDGQLDTFPQRKAGVDLRKALMMT